MEPMQWLTLAVFGLTILVVITNVIDSTLAALLGVAVMCWLGIVTETDAFNYVDWNVMAILVGIWIIAGYFGKMGHWIDSGSAARRKTRYCRRNLCPNG